MSSFSPTASEGGSRLRRGASGALACVVAGLLAVGCGSSATTSITSPGAVSKCAVAVTPPGTPLPASGGGGQVAVVTARECAWSAASESAWLSIKSGASGQGDGMVQFEAVANPDPAVRRGAIVLNDRRAEITQAAGECIITLGEEAVSFTPTGGSGRIDVRASSALCTWTAVADVDWISVRTGATGTGTGAVTFDVAATAGPPRTGGITVAGRRFVVTQSQGCAYTLTPAAYQARPEGGPGSVSVMTTAGCTWAASSPVDWIQVGSAETSTGPGAVSFTVAPTTGPTRSATLTIAGQPFAVTQGQGCSYTLSPDSGSVPAAGGSLSVSVTSGGGCAWTASSNTSWITVTSGSQGNGGGTVQLAVAATSGPNRSGSVTIAGRTFTVNQGQGCTFAITPTSGSIDVGGGQGSFSVQTEGGCAWSANEDTDWLSFVSGSTGSGAGTVTFAAAANPGPARSATITAAGQTYTVSQAGGCSYGLSSTGASVPGAGGTGTVGVTSAAGCAWTAASNANWISITGGASGSGGGTVSFTASAQNGPARSGTLTIAGLTFTVTQGDACSFAVSPAQNTVAAGGGAVTFSVTTSSGCRWGASTTTSWLSVPSGAGGTDDGSVQVTASANAGPARSGTVTVAGRTVTVNQAGGCAYTIAPTSQAAGSGSGTGSVAVTAGAGCGWTAASSASWLVVSSGASGSGNGTVQYAIDANTGAARSATLTIGGRTFTVTQASGCSYAIAPSSQTVPGPGGDGTVNVTASAGCTWTSASNVPWARITLGATGTGSGPVQFTADPNTGAARSGTLTVAGQTFSLSQDAGCTFAVAPDVFVRTSAASTEFTDVTAPGGCAWTAVSNAPWATITGGASGSGNGRVDFALSANTGPSRTGTLTVAGRTVTVTQDAGCTFAVAPDTFVRTSAASTEFTDVTAPGGCAWTAVSNAPWATITGGASGSGNGRIDFALSANTGPSRTGTLTVAGRTVTVTQDTGCTYTLGAMSHAAPTAGGPGSVTVTTAPGCTWTAATLDAWIIVTAGASGTGDGTVQFTVNPNATGAPRSGTITIAGQAFTVTQP